MLISRRSFRGEETATLAALDKSQAIIEFKMDGTIVRANENFLKTMGYRLEEIEGKHHSLFVEPAYRESAGIESSGPSSTGASIRPHSSSESAKAGRKSGSRRPIIRCSVPVASLTRS
jgi:PAS domain S-box